MRGFLILCLSLWLSNAQAQPLVLYLDAAFGTAQQGPDLAGSLIGARHLGKLAVGAEWQMLYIELEHISDVQQRDTGLDVLWLGLRKEIQF